MCTIQHSWFYSDFFAKHLGELSSWIVVFGPCRALRGESTISKMCVQFNILDSILIFVPNIWGSYQVWLLSLGPVWPWGGEGTISKMCLLLNILDSILTVGLQHLSGAQLSGAPGPTFRGPICLEPPPLLLPHTHTEMFWPNIRIDWKMFSHIPELISPPPPFTLKPRPEICFQPPKCLAQISV